MSDPVTPPYRYSLQSIEVREAHVFPVPAMDEAASGLNFNVNLENLVNEEQGWILCAVTVNIATVRSAVALGKLTAVISFQVADIATVLQKSDQGVVVVPSDLHATLNGIAISTTRGIMFGMFKGTQLHGAYLPLMDIKAFMPELPLAGK